MVNESVDDYGFMECPSAVGRWAYFVLADDGAFSRHEWFVVTDKRFWRRLGSDQWRSPLFMPNRLRVATGKQLPLSRPRKRDKM